MCVLMELPLLQGREAGTGEGEGSLMALLSPSIDTLSLTGLKLTACPAEVLWHSAVLKDLSLAHNSLTSLPPAISSCRHLQRLNLESNKLTIVPEAIFSMAALRVLQLSDNSIDMIPSRLSELYMLRMLLVGNNQLRSFGPGITCAHRCALHVHTVNGSQRRDYDMQNAVPCRLALLLLKQRI